MLILLLATLGAPPLSLGSGRTIVVPRDYPDIQTAVDRASAGDVIAVLPGEYGGFRVSKPLTVVGSGPGEVVVNGKVIVSADGVRVGSMRIVFGNPSSGSDPAVEVVGRSVVLANVVIDSEGSGVRVGSASYTEGDLTLEDSSIVAGKDESLKGSIGIWGSCRSLTIRRVSVYVAHGSGVRGCGSTDVYGANVSSLYAGISFHIFMEAATVRDSRVSSRSGAGIEAYGSRITIEGCSVTGTTGIDTDAASRMVEIRNSSIGSSGTGVRLVGKSCVVRGNTISGNRAIELYGDGNRIVGNVLRGGRGVHGYSGYGNEIAYNVVYRTGSIGIYMSQYTSDNVVYGNAFWLCYNYEAVDESGRNAWYNETARVGNYWSSHRGPDADGDGIVDVPYSVATTTGKEILDRYPLVNLPEALRSVIASLEGTTTTSPATPTTSPPTTATPPTETSPPYSTPPYETTCPTTPPAEAPADYTAYVVLGSVIVVAAALASLFARKARSR